MNVTITLKPDAATIMAGLKTLPLRMAKAIAAAHDFQNELTITHTKVRRLYAPKEQPPRPASEGVLRRISGDLGDSLRASKAVISENGVVSAIGSRMPYAGIHEFGGVTGPHVIRPRSSKALRFEVGGKTVFARRVNHPGSRIPARSPIRRGIEDRTEDYSAAISKAITQTPPLQAT